MSNYTYERRHYDAGHAERTRLAAKEMTVLAQDWDWLAERLAEVMRSRGFGAAVTRYGAVVWKG